MYDIGSVVWGYVLSDVLCFIVSYGMVFKVLIFNEFYYFDYGNFDLDVEILCSLEVGLSGMYGWGYWVVNVFCINVDDLIGNDLCLVLGCFWG